MKKIIPCIAVGAVLAVGSCAVAYAAQSNTNESLQTTSSVNENQTDVNSTFVEDVGDTAVTDSNDIAATDNSDTAIVEDGSDTAATDNNDTSPVEEDNDVEAADEIVEVCIDPKSYGDDFDITIIPEGVLPEGFSGKCEIRIDDQGIVHYSFRKFKKSELTNKPVDYSADKYTHEEIVDGAIIRW